MDTTGNSLNKPEDIRADSILAMLLDLPGPESLGVVYLLNYLRGIRKELEKAKKYNEEYQARLRSTTRELMDLAGISEEDVE